MTALGGVSFFQFAHCLKKNCYKLYATQSENKTGALEQQLCNPHNIFASCRKQKQRRRRCPVRACNLTPGSVPLAKISSVSFQRKNGRCLHRGNG